MKLPHTYTAAKVRQYCGKTIQNNRYINGSCPICREGSSWGKKKRFFYIIPDDYMYCHNCGFSSNPYWFVKEVTGMTWKEIKDDVMDYSGEDISTNIVDFDAKPDWKPDVPALPGDCVNITDINQLKFHFDNPVIQKALAYIKSRRLDKALFSPRTYYICLNDKHHKNRIVIPYYDEYGRVLTYTSRIFLDGDKRPNKYLLKFNSVKEVFNLEKLDSNIPEVFVIEGPIDTMFVRNGIGISGTSLTTHQEEQLNGTHPFHQKIWIFDNYRFEGPEIRKKIADKIREGETIFLYDGPFEEYKDLNQYCIAKGLDFVDPDLLKKYSYSGEKTLLRL